MDCGKDAKYPKDLEKVAESTNPDGNQIIEVLASDDPSVIDAHIKFSTAIVQMLVAANKLNGKFVSVKSLLELAVDCGLAGVQEVSKDGE